MKKKMNKQQRFNKEQFHYEPGWGSNKWKAHVATVLFGVLLIIGQLLT